MSNSVKEVEIDNMPALDQEQDDQDLLDQQLHDSLFGQINDASSLDSASSPQHQRQLDDDFFLPEDDMVDESSAAAADNNTPSAEYGRLASPAPSPLIPTTPAGQVLSPSNKQYKIPPSELAFLKTQVADQPRIPWQWSTTGKKDSSPYKPTAIGKWWYDYWLNSQSDIKIGAAASHVGRIMETELGVQLLGDKRCARCQRDGRECWIYSERGRKQIRHPGSACAHCRAMGPITEGCSVATRRHSKKNDTQPRPGNREIRPLSLEGVSPEGEE
ncbi:hypothetical protein TMatcc_003865 [Talaromyces marneffei ATCC 18224]